MSDMKNAETVNLNFASQTVPGNVINNVYYEALIYVGWPMTYWYEAVNYYPEIWDQSAL